ncbi:MAG: class I SAM-dependent methyltransferase [Thermomicrobium sp.]
MPQEGLVQRIREEIERTGPVTFARFMELALYDPDYGYYATAVRVGRCGDYLTAPEAHPIFGWVIARQLWELWDLLDRPAPFMLIEYGPGTGTLALSLFEYLARTAPDFLERLRYRPVEVSRSAFDALVDRLVDRGFASLLTLEQYDAVTGVVLANEVVDALPVHRVCWHKDQLWELFVDWDGERLVEVFGPPSTGELAHWLERLGVQLREGQTTELCLAMVDWVEDVARVLARGYVLVLDYGYPAPERYDPVRFPKGTVRTYFRHSVGDDPLQSPGEQDITAHVDFTMLGLAAQERGFTVLGLTTQAEFLAQAGLGELLVQLQREPGMTAERYLAARAAALHLLDPAGMGRFRVLLLGKRVPEGVLPSGFCPRLLTGVDLPFGEYSPESQRHTLR